VANYSIELRRTASTTASVGTVTADATRPRRGKLYYLSAGSEATPADNAFLWRVRRVTAAGTSTAVTPTAQDPADAATETDAGENHSVEPTYTSNSEMIVLPLNQKATVQWQQPPGREIVWPATASNGLGIDTPTATAVAVAAMLYFTEQ
jgi:hypothetical protein